MKKILLFAAFVASVSAFSQQRTRTSGLVKDTNGNPLPGVAVVVKGTTEGVVTNFDGNYEIAADPNGILVFSYIGMKTQELPVNGRETINVTMEEEAQQLQDVIVTALGITKDERRVGYAVSTVDSKQFTQAKEPNFVNSLAGTVAGLNVKGTSSGAGGTSKILLRGLPSMTSSGSPLIVIDGIPMDNTQRGSANQWGGTDSGDGLGNLNSDDIQTITVLKGQSASSLYGARASNGVIMITTKKGVAGNWAVTYNGTGMAETAIDYTNFQSVYGQGENGRRPTTASAALMSNRLAWGERLDGRDYTAWDGSTQKYSKAARNYIGFYRVGYNISNTISTTKGWEDGSMRFSVGNFNSSSFVPNSSLDRYTVNLNADQKLGERLSINTMVNFVNQDSKKTPIVGDASRNVSNFIFLAPNLDYRQFAPGSDVRGYEVRFNEDPYGSNPYFVTDKFINDLSRSRLIAMLSAKYDFVKPDKHDILKKLDLVQITGYDISNDNALGIEPTGMAYTPNLQGNYNPGKRLSQRSELNLALNLSSTLKLGENFGIDALVGGNIRKNKYETSVLEGQRFVLPFFYSPNNVVTPSRQYDYAQSQVNSAYYSVDFNFKELVTLSTTGRYDIYSSLPSNNRSIFTPSVSANFNFSELTQEALPFLDFGKLRASYAVTSGEPEAPYQNNFYYESGKTFNGVPTASFSYTLPNLYLKPFTVNEAEVGLEARMLNNRLSFDVAFYQRRTNNEIMKTAYSGTSGFTGGVVATGSTQNTGLEVLVSGIPVQTKNFSWQTSINLTSVKNLILNTDDYGNTIYLGTTRFYGGGQTARTAYVKGLPGPQIVGYDYKRDANGNILYDNRGLAQRTEQYVNFGTVLPILYGGWNNQFSFKNFSASFLIDYNFGNKVLSSTEAYSVSRGLNESTLYGREGGVPVVTEAGQALNVDPQTFYQDTASRIATIGVVSGDFLKLRQVTLGYTFPRSKFKKVALIDELSVSLVARNLFILWKEAKNIDPESTFGSNVQFYGMEGLNLPSTRTFGINLNIKLK